MATKQKHSTDEACPHCGTTYGAFRCYTIANYSDAYHQIAWTREHAPSRRAVLSHWAACKGTDWREHVAHCGDVVECEPVDSADFADDDFADDTDFDFGWNAPADTTDTDTDNDTKEGNEMTTTNTTTKTNRTALSFRCPNCDARRMNGRGGTC